MNTKEKSISHLSLWIVMTFMASSAAILTRFCGISSSSIGFWRVAGASIVLLPWWLFVVLKDNPKIIISKGAIITGIFLGLHFATWSWALLNSPLANASLFISLQPAVAPILGYWLNKDNLNKMEIIGTILACGGMVWILSSQILFSPEQIIASLVTIFSMLCCSFYFVLGRKFRSTTHIILFTEPVYISASLVQFIAAVIFENGIKIGDSLTNRLSLLSIILFPTVGGHTISLFLLKDLKAHTVTLSIPLQFIIVTILGIILFKEIPQIWFFPGALIVLTGVLMAILNSEKTK